MDFFKTLFNFFNKIDRPVNMEQSNQEHYLDLRCKTNVELNEINKRYNKNWTLKEAIEHGIPFDNLCRKQLEEVMKDDKEILI